MPGAGEPEPDLITLSSEVAYENRWMKVRHDRVRRRDGSEGVYGFIDKLDFVIIAPVDRGVVHLVQQYRYPIGTRQWEFPQGGWEGRPEVDLLEVAAGELEEETGLRAAKIVKAGQLYPLYGTTNQSYGVYIATGLTEGLPRREVEEQDLVTEKFSLSEFERMIADGEIRDAGTIASFGLLRIKGLV